MLISNFVIICSPVLDEPEPASDHVARRRNVAFGSAVGNMSTNVYIIQICQCGLDYMIDDIYFMTGDLVTLEMDLGYTILL